MLIIIEAIILCAIFTLMVCVIAKNPIKSLYNYPPKIQERVKSLKQYENKIPTTKNKLVAKCGFSLVVVIIVSLIMKYLNDYNTFLEGFGYSFLLWSIVDWYDAFIMDCLWFCHDKRFVLEGTEDMVEEYHNYWYHIKGSMIGEFIGLVVCALIGLVVMIL